jgi:hypothetical protein
MPDITKLEESLPEGISYDSLKSILAEAGYDIVPSGEGEGPDAMAVEVSATPLDLGGDEEEDEEKEEDEDKKKGKKPPFMSASKGDQLSRVEDFMKEEGL